MSPNCVYRLFIWALKIMLYLFFPMIEVWIQEGEPCVPRYGYRATDIRTLAHQANECANGLECKHTGYSGHICIRLKPGR